MPAGTLIIDGLAREWRANSLHIVQGVNGRSTLAVDVRSLSGGYVPAQDDEVTFEDGASSVVFRGLITEPEQHWLVPGGVALMTQVNAEDFSALAARRLVTGATTGGISGRDAIDFVVDTYLAPFGVTRDPGMPAGATLGALSYRHVKADNVLNDIVGLAAPQGWLWRIDEDKVLRAWAPSVSTWPCPWSVTSGSSKIAGGDVTVTRSREHYANRVILDYKNDAGAQAVAVAEDTGEQTAHGIYEAVVQSPGPLDSTTAQALADAYLARLVLRPLTIQFRTREPGARAGQTLTVSLPVRGLSGDFLITEVQIRDAAGEHLLYDITAVEGGTMPPTWKDTYRQWSGQNSGVAIAGGGTVVVTTSAEGGVSLGGASAQPQTPGAGNWMTVVNAPPFVATRTGSALVRAKLWSRGAGVTVTARLYDLTTPGVVATSSGVVSQTPVVTPFAASLVAGRSYELQVSCDTNGADVYALGSLVSI